MKKLVTPLLMFFSGGALYVLLEFIWRRHSHWSMFLAGGTCLLLIDGINRHMKRDTPLWLRCTVGAAVITVVEFFSGCIVNLWADWHVWDYSRYKANFMGQVCLLYTVLWFFLSAPVIYLGAYLRKRFDRLTSR